MLPEGWENRRLEEVCRLWNGKAYKKEELLERGKYLVLRVGNFFTNDKWYYSDLELEEEKYCDDGDLLYAWSASFGPRIWAGGKVIYHYHIWKVAIDDRLIDKEFLFHFLDWDAEQIKRSMGSGSTMIHVTKGAMEQRAINLPPIDEQRRIAEVLRSVDEAIALSERAAMQARSTLDALLYDYFCSDGGDASCANLTPLSDLVSLQSGFAFKSQEYQHNGHFLMRISNVQDGQVSLENPKFVTLDKKTQAFELQEGDILTSLTGNIGRVARLTTAHLPAALNQRVARIKPKSQVSIDADYLFFALKSPLFKASLFAESGGAAQQNVSPKAIGRVEIPLSPMEEQRRIGEMLLGIDDVIVQSEGALEQLQNVKINLMSDLLSGRVRVPS